MDGTGGHRALWNKTDLGKQEMGGARKLGNEYRNRRHKLCFSKAHRVTIIHNKLLRILWDIKERPLKPLTMEKSKEREVLATLFSQCTAQQVHIISFQPYFINVHNYYMLIRSKIYTVNHPETSSSSVSPRVFLPLFSSSSLVITPPAFPFPEKMWPFLLWIILLHYVCTDSAYWWVFPGLTKSPSPQCSLLP